MSQVLSDAVVVVAGAGGGAGGAAVRHLAAAGATVVMADTSVERLDPIAESVAAAGSGAAVGYAVDLLDEAASTAWARSIVEKFGRVDGVVHLVGGWRGGKGIVESDLADWALLSDLLIRTVQHTSRGFHDALLAAPAGRYVLISAAAASRPTADSAAYAAAKAAAEAWTLAVGDSFRGSSAAATVLVVKALLTPAMREAKPEGKFTGFTDVEDLASEIVALWDKPAAEVNGARLWLTN